MENQEQTFKPTPLTPDEKKESDKMAQEFVDALNKQPKLAKQARMNPDQEKRFLKGLQGMVDNLNKNVLAEEAREGAKPPD